MLRVVDGSVIFIRSTVFRDAYRFFEEVIRFLSLSMSIYEILVLKVLGDWLRKVEADKLYASPFGEWDVWWLCIGLVNIFGEEESDLFIELFWFGDGYGESLVVDLIEPLFIFEN